MNISEDYKAIITIALSEFKSHQIDFLLDFAARYKESLSASNLQCMFNCVHLYEKAEKALKEIGGKHV